VDVAVVQNWLTTMGASPRLEQPIAGVVWWVNFGYPRGATQIMRVQTFEEWPKAVFIASTGQMPVHAASAFGRLSDTEKAAFTLELQAVLLNAPGILYQVEPTSPNVLTLPTHIHVMAIRYETSVSMDSLHRSILEVHKAEQLWQNFILRRFGFPTRSS
jgi:hypothetical protein